MRLLDALCDDYAPSRKTAGETVSWPRLMRHNQCSCENDDTLVLLLMMLELDDLGGDDL